MARNRRTKKQYAELYDNPKALFPNVETLLWPNGEPEIWFRDKYGLAIRIKVGAGSAGLGLTVDKFVSSAPLTVTGNLADEQWTPQRPATDMQTVSITQHGPDEYSQAFRKWYDSDKGPDGKHLEPYPDDIGLKPTRTFES